MSNKRPDDAQSQRFIETARELGCDDDLGAFKAKLKVIARQKPKDTKQDDGAEKDGGDNGA